MRIVLSSNNFNFPKSIVSRLNFNTFSHSSLESISACFTISANPERMFLSSSVLKKSTLIKTLSAGANTPISFFRPKKLIPVFPPVAASTAPNKVVETLIYRIPRLKVEAVNPPISVITPPPRLIINDLRVAPFSLRYFHISTAESIFLCSSPLGMVIK